MRMSFLSIKILIQFLRAFVNVSTNSIQQCFLNFRTRNLIEKHVLLLNSRTNCNFLILIVLF